MFREEYAGVRDDAQEIDIKCSVLLIFPINQWIRTSTGKGYVMSVKPEIFLIIQERSLDHLTMEGHSLVARYSGSALWRKWESKISLTTERDFERAILPFLQIHWPDLQQTPARGYWDALGIDLMLPITVPLHPCLIQCKGFHVIEIGNDQILQIEQSIDAFIKSGQYCKDYIVVHNRDGRNRNATARIENKLKIVRDSGQAERAEMWDLPTCFDNAFQYMRRLLANALRDHSAKILRNLLGRFTFGAVHVPKVPISIERLLFKRGQPCQLVAEQEYSLFESTKLLHLANEPRWMLLVGQFGVGKTTSVLHAAASCDHIVIYAQAAQLDPKSLTRGTVKLLQEIVARLDVFTGYEATTKTVLDELAGPVLSLLLQSPSPYLLVLDGLDENRAYSGYVGLERLSNQLADFKCPIILTTRREHLDALFGDFTTAFEEFSTKNTAGRYARLVTLQGWDTQHIESFIEAAVQQSTEHVAERLSELLCLFRHGETQALYGDLPRNPLFLQFIVEDVIEHGIRPMNRCTLLRDWVAAKIRRDRKVLLRPVPNAMATNLSEFVSQILLLMEHTAGSMVEQLPDGIRLVETLPVHQLRVIAQRVLGTTGDSELAIMLNSVLTTAGHRVGDRLPIAFTFRVF
ncbi:MAG TPA: hypothetical protein VGL77_01020, partial [Armatimonadota bacterium]